MFRDVIASVSEAIHRATRKKAWIASAFARRASADAVVASAFARRRASTDRSAPRNDGWEAHLRDPAARFARVVRKPSAPKRAQGTPGARCTRGLVCKSVQKNAHEHTGSAEAIRHSLRNGFNGLYRALPGDRACLTPSPANMVLSARLGSQNLRRLDANR
jgi:hypothetical protein